MVAAGERRNDAVDRERAQMNKLLLIGLVASLGACDSGEVDKTNATPAEVAEAVSDARSEMKFKPGRWESSVTFVSMEAPGMPAEVAKAMQGTLGKDHRYATCLTREEAEKPAADFFARDAKDCTYDHFTLGDGKIDARMRCGGEGRAVAMVMNGAYDDDSYDMAMETRVEAGDSPMTMKMKIASNHVGACRGDEDANS